jgi:hypothetical protein
MFLRYPVRMTEALTKELKATLHKGTEDRGWVVNSYAQFENLLSDLVRRAKALPEYSDLEVPYRTVSRVARVRELLARDGPLNQYQNDLVAMLDRFESFEDVRLMMVHGYVHVEVSHPGGAVTFHFEHWRRETGGETVSVKRQLTPAELTANGQFFSQFANEALGLFRRIHRNMGWVESSLVPETFHLL